MAIDDVLTPEQRVIILASRLTFSEDDERELAKIIRLKLDWFQIFRMALKNKVLSLLWNNLKVRYYDSVVPQKLRTVFNYDSIGTKERNSIFLQEFTNVIHALNSGEINCVPTKGNQLLPYLYKDYCLRIMGDLDFLIRKSDGRRIRQVMNSIGYVEGDYDHITKSIKKLDRRRLIYYQTGMHQLVTFNKPVRSEFVEFIPIDFTFLLDFDSDPTIVDSLISRSIRREETGYLYLRPSDFFIYLCCNIYKDAFNATVIFKGKDLPLINFCDVREYMLQIMNNSQIIEALRFVKGNGIEKAVYFVLHCLRIIYNDGYEEPLMKTLNVKDTGFVERFGEKEFGYAITWKKTFWQRLFSDNNKDELREVPGAAKILGGGDLF